MEGLSRIYQDNVARFDELLGVGRSCDMVARDFRLGGRRARIWVVDGYGRDAILERMGAFWLGIPAEGLKTISKMQDFIDRFITFSETNVSFDVEDIVTSVLLGKTLFLLEGAEGAALIDAKDYPSRGVGEPEDGKVLRGSHDGFVEAVVPNMALLRRRIRDPELTMEGHKVGTRSRTDVVLCYLRDRADPKLLDRLRDLLGKVDVRSLSMGQESLAEAIRKAVSWALGGSLAAFTLYLTLTGAVSGAADQAAVRAAKAVLSGTVPVVGGILSDAAETLLAGAGVLRGGIGIFGTLGVLAICAYPFLHLGIQYLLYRGAGFLAEAAGGGPLPKLIGGLGSAFALVLGMTASCAAVIIVAIAAAMGAAGL